MKRTVMCCLIGLVLLVSTVRSEAQTTSGTEKAVAALEEQWLQSQKTNNPDLTAPLLAENSWTHRATAKLWGKPSSWRRRNLSNGAVLKTPT
jgi:hypothetical protein